MGRPQAWPLTKHTPFHLQCLSAWQEKLEGLDDALKAILALEDAKRENLVSNLELIGDTAAPYEAMKQMGAAVEAVRLMLDAASSHYSELLRGAQATWPCDSVVRDKAGTPAVVPSGDASGDKLGPVCP